MTHLKKNTLKYLAFASACLGGALISPAHAQRTTPVTVQNTEGKPVLIENTALRIPVRCSVTADRDVRSFNFNCSRQDQANRAFSTVPNGYKLALTDFSYAMQTGDFFSEISTSEPGIFRSRALAHSGNAYSNSSFHYASPILTLQEGGRFTVTVRTARGSTNPSFASVNVYASGYLVKNEDIGK